MSTCFRCGVETETYQNGFPSCSACVDALVAPTKPTAKDERVPNDTHQELPQKLARAVIRGIDTAPRTTSWVPFGSPELQNALIAILPPAGENFTVVWETRDANIQAA
jgi:hypothetical protein